MTNIPNEDNNTIQRCPHDKENPYSMVNRDLIRDPTISPECRWLIIYLLSMKDGWKINVKQILTHVKPFMGRDKLHKTVNEAIEAGYMLREECTQPIRRPNGSLQGKFKRVRYFISETPKFKKCLPRPSFPEPDNPAPENQDDKERAFEDLPSKKKEHIKESNTPTPPPVPCGNVHNSPPAPKPPAPEPAAISTNSIPSSEGSFSIEEPSQLIELLKMDEQLSPFFRPEILARWIHNFGAAHVLDTVRFFFHIKATQKKPIQAPEKWMEKALKESYAKVSQTCQENKIFAENLKKRYSLRRLKINKRYCQDTQTGRDFYYHLPTPVFQAEILRLAEQEQE